MFLNLYLKVNYPRFSNSLKSSFFSSFLALFSDIHYLIFVWLDLAKFIPFYLIPFFCIKSLKFIPSSFISWFIKSKSNLLISNLFNELFEFCFELVLNHLLQVVLFNFNQTHLMYRYYSLKLDLDLSYHLYQS